MVAVLFVTLQRPPPAGMPNAVVGSMERRMHYRAAEALVVGNSLARRDIDLAQLSEGLGLAAREATLAGTSAPAWFVVLRDRVFGGDLSPSLVVVAGTPAQLLTVSPASRDDRELFFAAAKSIDPVLAARIRGEDLGERLSSGASALRTAAVDGYRNAVAGLVFAPVGEGTLGERGSAVADAAAYETIGEGGEVAAGLEGWEGEDFEFAEGRIAAPAESFLADMIDVAEAGGARIMFVALPTKNELVRTGETLGRVRAIAQFLDGREVAFLDLGADAWGPEEFEDMLHMAAPGRRRATARLIDEVTARGILGEGEYTPNVVTQAPIRVEREGEVPTLDLTPTEWPTGCLVDFSGPELDVLGDLRLRRMGIVGTPIVVAEDGVRLDHTSGPPRGCVGLYHHSLLKIFVSRAVPGSPVEIHLDPEVGVRTAVSSYARIGGYTPTTRSGIAQEGIVYWVFPGTTTRIELPDIEGGEALISALAVQRGAADATLEVDGQPVPLARDHRVLRGVAPVHSGSIVRLSSPVDGPWLVIRALRVGDEWYLGTPTTFAGAVEMLPRADVPVTARYEVAPPPIAQQPAVSHVDGLAAIPIDEPDWLSWRAALRLVGQAGCVPLRVDLGDGTWMPGVRARERGVTFLAPVGASLATMRLAWDPERRCRVWPSDAEDRLLGATRAELVALRAETPPPPPEPEVVRAGERWLYRGDRLTLTRPDLEPLQTRPAGVRILAYRLDRAGTLDVAVDIGGQPAGSWSLPASPSERIDQILPLAEVPGVLEDPNGAYPVEIRLGADGLVLVRQLQIVEAP